MLAGCSDLLNSRTALLGDRKAAHPLAAAESYLRQYQPGPLPRVFQTTRLYDRNGVLIAETFGEGRRIWVGLDRISTHLIEATIAVEDATFYTNPGVDARRIAGAALQNLQEGEIVSGASTITMQLARNLFLGDDQRYDQSVDRKVLEAGLAQELTELYSKDEILEMYLNLLNYGQLAYGPEAAAQVYFGKPAAELTLAEATLLAGLPQQPANLNPYENLDAARVRQKVVLDLMVRHGNLIDAEADAVFAEPIQLAGDPGLAPNLAPHFVQYVIEQLNATLGEEYTQRAGFQVITSLDLEMQQLAQETVRAKVAELQPQFDLSNGALVAMQPSTGEVLVMVGSADFTSEAIAGQVNVALSPRQPGSAIKPILYATAIEDNLVAPASVLWDIPVTYTVGLPTSLATTQMAAGSAVVYRPLNYDETFHGPVTVRTALANSYNVPTVKLLNRLGVPRMLEMARVMGVHSLNRDSSWYGLSLTLGGGEVTLLDLTTAYQTLAADGVYRPPKSVLELRDSRGQTIAPEAQALAEIPVESAEPQANQDAPVQPALPGSQVLSPDTAFLVTDILADNAARTPAFGANSPLVISRPAAVKTGTTSDFRDNWTVGYTRYLVAGVWAGNSDGRPMRNASGVTGAAPIWNAFMESVLARPEMLARVSVAAESDWQFVPPPDLAQGELCPPAANCRAGGEFFRTSWLQAAGDDGPLSGSVVKTPAAPVYAQRGEQSYLAGFCGLEGAAERTMLALPSVAPTEEQAPVEQGGLLALFSSATAAPEAEAPVPLPTLEEQQVRAWALRHGAPVYLGLCEQLGELLPAALAIEAQEADGELRVVVDMAAAGNPEVAGLSPDGGVPLEVVSRSVEAGLLSGGPYTLAAPIVHDWACPGNYIMGQVINAEGAPVAGVQIMLQDSWGNQTFAVSKNGQNDYGMFDFPIYGDGPQNLVVTLLDGAGNPVSAGITIPHKQDAVSDTPCHHVVVRGG
jgi:penicillin-binding protein 1C